MYEQYKQGLSLEQLSILHGVTRQGIHKAFKLRGFELRVSNERPFQMLDGVKFSERNNGYYASTVGKRQLMHRYVWERHYGSIPHNHDIHHRDSVRGNNDPKNLDCLPKAEHARRYATGNNQYIKNEERRT